MYNIFMKHTEEFKQKQSESRMGENHPLYGKCRSEETKNKISEGNKRNWILRKSKLNQIDNNI